MRNRLPVETERAAEIDVGAGAEAAAVEHRVPLQLRPDAIPADSDEGIQYVRRMRQARQVTEADIVLERDRPEASRHVQLWRDAVAHFDVAIVSVQVNLERRAIDTIATEAGPEAVGVDEPFTRSEERRVGKEARSRG